MIWQRLPLQKLTDDGFHLQTHVVGQRGEEMVLDVAADQRVSKSPVQDWVSGQVEDSMAHLVDPLWSLLRREHGQTYVLKDVDVNVGQREDVSGKEHTAERSPNTEPTELNQDPQMRPEPQKHQEQSPERGEERPST